MEEQIKERKKPGPKPKAKQESDLGPSLEQELKDGVQQMKKDQEWATDKLKEAHSEINKLNPAVVGKSDRTRKTPEQIKAEQDAHPKMKWFDLYHCKIVKENVHNPLANKNEVIITGWILEDKVKSIFTEPHLINHPADDCMNRFALGFGSEGTDGKGQMGFLQGTVKGGDRISYMKYLNDMGMDLDTDPICIISRLLNVTDKLK